MKYVWKCLSLITLLATFVVAVPLALLGHGLVWVAKQVATLHMAVARRANPNPVVDAIMDNVQKLRANPNDPEAMGKAIAEMMKAMNPEVVAGAKAAADRAVGRAAWQPEPPPATTISPVLARNPNLPPLPVMPATPTCCQHH